MIRTSLKSNKRIITLYITILVIGIISGILYYQKINIDLFSYFKTNIIRFNIYHIFSCILIITLNYIYIGPILSFFSMFLEGFSTGLIFYTLTLKRKIKGFIFSVLLFLFGKLTYLIILLLLGIYSLKYMFKKEDKNKYLNYSIITTGLCFINEIIISLFINKIWNYFYFLIK